MGKRGPGGVPEGDTKDDSPEPKKKKPKGYGKRPVFQKRN